MAAITDKFSGASNGSRPSPTTVTSTRSSGVTTLQCAALTGWRTTNPVHFVTYRTDAQGVKIDSSQCDWKGIVSGTQITNLTLRAGTDAGNAIGDTVVCMPTAAWADDLADGVAVSLDVDGTLKSGAVDVAAVLASDVVTTAKILDANVTTAKINNDAVTSAKMLHGMIRGRQGGATGDASWGSTGTSNTDTSAKDVFVQVGSVAVTANPTTVTFPNAFSQTPVVFVSTASANSHQSYAICTTKNTTTADFRVVNDAGTAVFTEAVNWIAIGQ